MKTPELKPCPFCGGEAVLESFTVRKGYEAVIHCNGSCLANMPTITFETEEEANKRAVDTWNRRAKDETDT